MAARAFDVRDPRELKCSLERFSDADLEFLHSELRWRSIARVKQIPAHDNWSFFGIKSGRGFGKTLSGAKWLFGKAAHDPGSYNFVVAPTHED